MRRHLLCILFITASFATKAQEARLNHIALHVHDLAKSSLFYTKTIGLDTIPEPFHDGRHTWLSIGPKSHLHLIAGAGPAVERDKNTHLCFTVPSVDAFAARLKTASIPFEDVQGNPGKILTRVDGVKQIYFRDPDGYWIEINDARE
jgi:lactoylglutathione lyase